MKRKESLIFYYYGILKGQNKKNTLPLPLISTNILSLMSYRKKIIFPFIKQAGAMECGTTALAMIFKYYGFYDVRSFLSSLAEVNTEGTDLYTLSEIAEGFGFETEGYQMSYEHLDEIPLPCMAHYEGNHFVVIYKHSPRYIWIADPAIGKYKLSREEFENRWNGVILMISPTPDIFKQNELTELAQQQKAKKKTLWKNYYWGSLVASKSSLLKILSITIILQVLGLALPFFTQTIIDQVLVSQNIKLLYIILLGLVLVFATQVILGYTRNILLAQVKAQFERSFFSKFFDHLIKQQQDYFDRHKREDFINRFQENLKIRQVLNPSILQGLIDFVFIGTYLLVLYYYNITLGIISTSFIIAYILIVITLSPKLKQLESLIFAENVKTMGKFLDTLLGVQTVRLLGIEKLKFWQWKNQYTKALNKVLETQRAYIRLSTLLRSIFLSSQVSIYWLGAYFTFTGQITIGQYIAFITIFTIIINSLNNITSLWFLFTELSVTFEKLNDVLIQEPLDFNILDKKQVQSPWVVKFEGLKFKYRSRDDHYVLEDINFEVQPGKFIGLVGRNGSGKSTLVKLLAGLYPDYEGEIKICDTELRQIMRQQIQKKISMIPQDVFLFDDSLKANIKYANPTASDKDIMRAIELADLLDFVKSQFLGLNLKIGENGVNLSGGQKLKVAFARLFLTDPDIIILDEASSALDVETEQKIMQNIRTHFKKKIIISIAHRLHTLKDANQIIVLDQGKLVEQGTHKDLIDQQGIYFQFLEHYVNF